MLQPGTRPEQTAYHLTYCGAQLLLDLTYSDSFPSESTRERKRGAKLMRGLFGVIRRGQRTLGRRLFGPGARNAHGGTGLRGELPDEAEHHLALCDTIEETFSFAVAHHHRLASLRADFSAHFDEQKERRLSILESAPERSLDTVLTPESYAAGYFRSGALINGIRITVGDDLASRLALAPPGLSSYDSLVRMRADQAGWNLVGGWWTAFAPTRTRVGPR